MKRFVKPLLVATLWTTMALSFISATLGLRECISFVILEEVPRSTTLPFAVSQLTSVLPANQSFGFFAPQVCAEYRFELRTGDYESGDVDPLTLQLGPEAQTLVSSLSNSAQSESSALAIADSLASYALTRDARHQAVEITLLVEQLPELTKATDSEPQWMPLRKYLYQGAGR